MDSLSLGAIISFLICLPVTFVIGLYFERKLKDHFGILSFFVLLGIIIASISTLTFMPNFVHQMRFGEYYFKKYEDVYFYHGQGHIQHRYQMRLHNPFVLQFELDVNPEIVNFNLYMDHDFIEKDFEALFMGYDGFENNVFKFYENEISLQNTDEYEFMLNDTIISFEKLKQQKFTNGDFIKIRKIT